MKTAQELYTELKQWERPELDMQPLPYYEPQGEAAQLAFNHTFGKGYNPEAMEDLIKTLALCYATTEDFVLINAIKSCLEKAKLK